MSRSFKVSKRSQGVRLIDFLVEELNCSSRKAKSLLDRRVVLVNRKRVWMAKHSLKVGDVVQVLEAPQSRKPSLDILFEDEHLLVLNKPQGLSSNGARGVETLLTQAFPGARVAHRLDTDTTGCLLCSRSDAVFEAIKNVFRKRLVEKRYQAVVYGRVTGEQVIQRRLDGKPAVSRFQSIKVGPEHSLLRIEIETGRRHQIRRHLHGIGHPVVGDKQYMMKRYPVVEAPRQLLHAESLAMPHPMCPSRELRVRAKAPKDFEEWAGRLRVS